MTYTRVFPQVGRPFTRLPPSVHLPAAGDADGPGGYFQRVESTKPRMMKPKPMPMFHRWMAPIG